MSKVIQTPSAWDDEQVSWTPPPWGTGSHHAIDAYAAPRDLIAEMHQVVLEVTGKPVKRPSKRIGFLP